MSKRSTAPSPRLPFLSNLRLHRLGSKRRRRSCRHGSMLTSPLKRSPSIASLLVNCGTMQQWAQYCLLILSSLRL